jgi:hypothetical protein
MIFPTLLFSDIKKDFEVNNINLRNFNYIVIVKIKLGECSKCINSVNDNIQLLSKQKNIKTYQLYLVETNRTNELKLLKKTFPFIENCYIDNFTNSRNVLNKRITFFNDKYNKILEYDIEDFSKNSIIEILKNKL